MKVLISRPDKIGDVILALHGVKQLKRLRPDWEIWIHGAPYTSELLHLIRFIDGVITDERQLKQLTFDIVVDLMAKPGTALSYARSNVKMRIGNSARWFRFVYHRRAYIRRSKALMNEAEYNWQLIRLVSNDLQYTNLSCALDAEDLHETPSVPAGKDRIVLMPGLTASALGWPVSKWTECAQILLDEGRKVLFLLGPAEQSMRSDFQEFVDENSGCSLYCASTLSSVMGIFCEATAYCGPSTGLTHLAGVFGLPGVALYPENPSMHPRRWAPFRSRMNIISLSRSFTPADVAHSLLTGEVRKDINPLHRLPLTGFVVCKDEEKNIDRCLESLSFCDEILVVDSGSTDRTLEIAKKYTDRILFREWSGHSDQKRFALQHCSHTWALNIDADEEVSMELKGQILRFLQVEVNDSDCAGFEICRLVYFLDRWWDKGGWHPEHRLRFFDRSRTTWGGVDPHEKAIVSGKTKKMPGFIYHYTYEDFSHQLRSLNNHSSLSAKCLYAEGKRAHVWNFFLNPAFRFFKFYILKKGYKEGLPGLLVASTEGIYTFLKYIKLWELSKINQPPENVSGKPSEAAGESYRKPETVA